MLNIKTNYKQPQFADIIIIFLNCINLSLFTVISHTYICIYYIYITDVIAWKVSIWLYTKIQSI